MKVQLYICNSHYLLSVLFQFLFAPPFIASFFVVNGLLMGVSFTDIKERLSKVGHSVLANNYVPCIHFQGFKVILSLKISQSNLML